MPTDHPLRHPANSVTKRLPQVIFFRKRVFPKQVVAVFAGCEDLKNTADSDPHARDTGLPATLAALP
jgi:hypothetical protein